MTIWRCEKCLTRYCIAGTFPKETGVEVKEKIRKNLGAGTISELHEKGVPINSRPHKCLHGFEPEWKSGEEMNAMRKAEEEKKKEKAYRRDEK